MMVKIDVKDAASLQIIYLIDQEGKYCFDLKIKRTTGIN